MRKSLTVAIIGCGRATSTLHLPALQRLLEVEVVALADINHDVLNLVSDQFGIQRRAVDYRSILEDPSIEAVAVCVPAQFHTPIALAALEAGKHLFIEKPLALKLDECDQLIAKAKSTNKKVLVGFNLRHHRLIQKSQKIIREGVLGKLEAVRSNWTSAIRYHRQLPQWRLQRESGGGVLFEIAVHHFDLWRCLLQSEIDEIFVLSRSEEWQDETAVITARMANGVFVTAFFSERTSDNNEIEIYGRGGRLVVSLYRFDGLEFYSTAAPSGGVGTQLQKWKHFFKELPTGVSLMRRGGDYKMSYQYEWRHFVEAIRNDLPLNGSLEDGRRAVQTVRSAIESAAVGGPVKIPNDRDLV